MKLYTRYDYENLYIMVKNFNDEKIYIPLDITDKSGSISFHNTKF